MSSSSAQFDNFVQTLQKLAQGYWGLDQEHQKLIQALLNRLRKDTVVVTFGGHFSSGKSTLINAALGRSLLPTLDYPETGAICVLCPGERDYAEVLVKDGYRAIDYTTTAISREISLTSSTGSQNVAVLQVKQLNIVLANSTIPRGMIWIDSPGINESLEMRERASEATQRSDVLAWVLNSRQFLSISEEEFLTEYIAERGPASVVFVANAFLNDDTLESWKTYHAKSFPVHLKKLFYRAPFMGFTDQVTPEVISVSARALCSYKTDGFGRREFRNLLNSLSFSRHPRIRRARLSHALITLHEIAAQIETKLKRERESFQQEQSRYERRQQEQQQQEKHFADEISHLISLFLEDWRSRARTCEANFISTLSSDNLAQSSSLNDSLKNAASLAVNSLLTKVTAACKQYNRKNLDSKDTATLKRLLEPPQITVVVANNEMKMGPGGAGAAVGAAVGTALFPGVGTLFGAIVGGIAGAVASGHSAVQKDVEDTKDNIRSAAQQAIAEVEGKRAEAIKFVIEHCVFKQSISPPETHQLRLLEKQFQIVSQLVHQAGTLARGEG